jgi:GTP-binding protein
MTQTPSGPAQGRPQQHRAIRNVAIIAHVDHGKTTLVDQLLKQSGMFRVGELDKLAGGQHGLIMDSNPLERERGITILSKNCAIRYLPRTGAETERRGDAEAWAPDSRLKSADSTEVRINIIDTPGHADFGGEVERVLRMADGCLLLVDAFDGPMPQTKFVLGKALEAGLRPVVVVNKCDRPDARPQEVLNEVFDLLVDLGAEDFAMDFKAVFCSARDGWASDEIGVRGTDLRPIFEMIVSEIPAPGGDPDAPLQMLVTTLDHSDYVGRIGIGRVFRGTVRAGQPVAVLDRKGVRREGRIGKLLQFDALTRVEVDEVRAGDLCAVVGLDAVDIGETIADPAQAEPLAPVTVDEPTMTMIFRVNDSPMAGREGRFVTSRQIGDRLAKELERNVALRVAPGRGAEEFIVSGRGVLHLGILLETMRREGYELAVGKPHVILRQIDGVTCEPVETLVIDAPPDMVGKVMEIVGSRRGELKKMEPRGDSMTHLSFEITSRALIGVRSRILTATQGGAVMHHRFLRYEPARDEQIGRAQGVMTATEGGQVTAYAVESLADRGILFVEPGDKVYAGQIVGEHSRDNDIPVNICRLKHLTNIRSSTKEATVVLKSSRKMSLEEALEYVEEDELVEITPLSIRLRKRILDEGARRRAERQARDKKVEMAR